MKLSESILREHLENGGIRLILVYAMQLCSQIRKFSKIE